jgi:uncharacterized protein (TIGR00369 family)
MTLSEIRDFLAAEFAPVFVDQKVVLEAAEDGTAQLSMMPDGRHLRPGGIVSGPTLMMLADTAAYAALLSLPADARMAVTSNLSVSFLRAGRGPIVQAARVVKPGRRLATILTEARDGAGEPLAIATLTYAMPAAVS